MAIRPGLGPLVLAMLLGAPCSCSAPGEPEYDGKVPGTLLGAFSVTGRLQQDACGADLLGAPNPWEFDVRLSQLENDVYWLNGREALVGDLDRKSGAFHFAVRVDVPLSAKDRARNPKSCTVSRYDSADGTFDSKDPRAARTFKAALTFEYRVKEGTECPEIIGVPGGFYDLPCSLRYDLRGERVSAP